MDPMRLWKLEGILKSVLLEIQMLFPLIVGDKGNRIVGPSSDLIVIDSSCIENKYGL